MGLILPQEVDVKVSSKIIKHYENKGYIIPKHIGYKGKECYSLRKMFKVSVLDMPNNSALPVKVYCDYCGETYIMKWRSIYEAYFDRNNDKVSCKKCRGKKYSETKRELILKDNNINPLYWDENWLQNEYLNKNRTAQSIADECNVHVRRIEKYIKLYNLDLKNIDARQKISKSQLYDLYVNQKLPLYEIAKEFHVNEGTTLKNLLYDYNIPIRTRKESMSLYYDKQGGRKIKSVYWRDKWKDKDFYNLRVKCIREQRYDMEKRIKTSCSLQKIDREEWNGFITPERTMIRNRADYIEWRNLVFQRDNYTCQCCGARSKKGCAVYLNAHHKENFADNPGLRFDINNGITLCSKCHDVRVTGSFHNIYGTLHNNTEQLNEYLLEKEFILSIDGEGVKYG